MESKDKMRLLFINKTLGFSKKWLFIFSCLYGGSLYAADCSIEKASDVAKFAGKMVIYTHFPAKDGDYSPYSTLEEENGHYCSTKQGIHCFIGFVLPEPLPGRENFYRLLPLVKKASRGFVRDFGCWFFKSCSSVEMRALNKDEYESLKRLLEKEGAKFDYETFERETDSNPKDLIVALLKEIKAS